MTTNKLLNLEDVSQMKSHLGNFLKPDPSDPVPTHDITDKDVPTNQEEYVCHNPVCVCLTRPTTVYVYEINGENTVIICDQCYRADFRFCLFTHEVLPLGQLESVLDGWFAQPEYNRGQLSPERLRHMDNLYQYFQMIGIENPCPRVSVIQLTEVDQFK